MTDASWNGFQINVTPDPMHKGRFKVEFHPLGAAPDDVDHMPVVTIEKQDQLRVIAFAPPAEPFRDLEQEVYEKEALNAVQEYLDQAEVT